MCVWNIQGMGITVGKMVRYKTCLNDYDLLRHDLFICREKKMAKLDLLKLAL